MNVTDNADVPPYNMKTALLFLACTTLVATAATPPEPTGASVAFTSSDPVTVRALGLVDAGDFKQAEAVLAESKTGADPKALQSRAELADLIRRIRLQYSLDDAGLLEKLKETIPNVTAAEAQRWAKEARVRYRMIDGKKFYFSREPQNIFLFCEEARTRRAKAGHAPKDSKAELHKNLEAIIAEAEKSGAIAVVPVKHRIAHTLMINPNNPNIKTGSVVKVWLPYPQEYRDQQRDVKMISASPEPKLIAPSAIEGNPVTGGPQRTVYFEQVVTDPSKPLEFKEEFEFTSYGYYPKLDESKVTSLPADWNGAYLSERLPHIAFTPEIKAQVAKIVGNETNALVKARKIFHWVSDNIPWNAEDEYCIIPSFAIKGFTAKRGDCGVQNTIYVTMCRIAGIPARWQSGFESKPDANWGMHDWAEIYLAPWGWLPADASYGVQKSKNPKVADFYCGHQDSYRWIVNLDWGRDLVPPKPSLRSEPADFQRGEVEVDGKNLYYDDWDTTTKIKRIPEAKP